MLVMYQIIEGLTWKNDSILRRRNVLSDELKIYIDVLLHNYRQVSTFNCFIKILSTSYFHLSKHVLYELIINQGKNIIKGI